MGLTRVSLEHMADLRAMDRDVSVTISLSL